ncbi:hypothetical protein [Nocardioides bigeumensis]|uniref:Uncharacterized protein n=1 Tax=Nocardioides bigeumensis TaxID=433657 RepID=A0ABP5JZ55_9ACTN
MHIDNSWLGMFKEQEELAAQQVLDEPEPSEPGSPDGEPGDPQRPRLRLVPPPELSDGTPDES